MKVIVDNKIPFIKEVIGKIADEVIYVPGKDFTPALVKDADALIIRTRTQCNRELLQGSRVQFIATATIGFDHIDTEYCHEAGNAKHLRGGSAINISALCESIQPPLLPGEPRQHPCLDCGKVCHDKPASGLWHKGCPDQFRQHFRNRVV